MSDTNETVDESLFDIRVVERNIARKKVTREQYEAYLNGLEDSAEHGAETETVFVHLVEDDEDNTEDANQ